MADSEASAVAVPPRAPAPANAAGAGAGAGALRGRSYVAIEAAADPPQAPPPARTTAALRGHLTRVADVVLLVYCVAIVARWACGDDSRAAAAAKKAADAAFVVMGVLVPVAFTRFIWILERCRKVGDRQFGSGVTGRGDVQRDRPATGSIGPGARPCQSAGSASVVVALLVVVLVCIPVILVGLLVQGHAPGKGSYQEKFGSAIYDMAYLIAMLVLCSFLLPGVIIQLLRHGSEVDSAGGSSMHESSKFWTA